MTAGIDARGRRGRGTAMEFALLVAGCAVTGVAGWWLGRRTRPGGPGGAGAPVVPAQPVSDYLESLGEFSRSVTPVWAAHIRSSRQQMEDAVGELVQKFAGIVSLLDTVLATSGGGGSYGEVFAASRARLDDVVRTLDSTVERKRRTLEELGTLMDLNQQMKAMTDEVTRIASQTHLLALNAAIEAQRVGEAGQAFGVVALEVRQLADLSGSAGERIGTMADQVSDAITGAFAAAKETAEVEETMVLEANTQVQTVLDDMLALVDGMQRSADDLGQAASGIKDQIAGSLVEFQFQDRITQTLGHVQEVIESFPAALAAAQEDGPERLRPLDHHSMAEQLKRSYTMAEEHEVHGSGAPAEVRDSEITFF